jgi:hypothetical protein
MLKQKKHTYLSYVHLNKRSLSRSIQTKEACPPVITAASPITSDPNVHSSWSQRFRGSCQQKLYQVLYLRWHQQRQQKFVPANQSGKPKKSKSRLFKRKSQKPRSNHGYEGLLSLMQGMLRRMDNMDKTRKSLPRVK